MNYFYANFRLADDDRAIALGKQIILGVLVYDVENRRLRIGIQPPTKLEEVKAILCEFIPGLPEPEEL